MTVAELSGDKLDYWVAKAEGRKCKVDVVLIGPNRGKPACQVWVERTDMNSYGIEYSPSTNWLHGGPIIERTRISVGISPYGTWSAFYTDPNLPSNVHWPGNTPLEAAMRCYVAKELGRSVPDEIPQAWPEGVVKNLAERTQQQNR